MEALLDALRAFRLWQAGVLLAVVATSGGAVYGGYLLITPSEGVELEEGQQLIPVQRGDLVNDVSINGSLVYSVRETLRFNTQGTIGRLTVEDGQRVSEGEELARLDAETVANLEKVVAQSRVALRNAEDALAKANAPYTSQQIAKAEADVASNRLSLKNAEEALDTLLHPTDLEVAQAQSAVVGTRLSVDDAEEALASLLHPTDLDIAEAEISVAGARQSVDDAEEALSKLLEPSALELAKAYSAVANTKSSLKLSEETLAALGQPSSLQLEQADSAVVSAKLSVAAAQEKVDTALAGPAESDVGDAQALIDDATIALALANEDLKLARRDWDQKLEDAREELQAAHQSYVYSTEKWLGVDFSADLSRSPENVLEAWGASLDTIFDRNLQSERLVAFFRGDASDDPSTPWDERAVLTWLGLYAGEITATCEGAALQPQTICVQNDLDDSWRAARAASDKVGTVSVQAAKGVSSAENLVSAAEQMLEKRTEALADIQSEVDPLDLEVLQSALAVAKAKLEDAQEDLALLRDGPDALDIEVQERQLSVAQANADKAQEDLADLMNGADSLEVEAQRHQLALAKVKLDKAQEELEGLMNGADSLEAEAQRRHLALARAKLDNAIADLDSLTNGVDTLDVAVKTTQVELAKASLSEAEETAAEFQTVDQLEIALKEADIKSAEVALASAMADLEGASLRAPWDGIVAAVSVEEGQQVNPNTAVLEMVDPTVVEVDGIVDEIDVLFLRLNAAAIVTLEALGDQQLGGVVSEIAATARNQQGVVSYPISIQVTIPEGMELPEGLSAVAQVIIREQRDGLLVPLQALHGTFDEPTLMVQANGVVEERPVTLGISDDFWTVITGGLVEGELVAIESRDASTDQFGGFQAFRSISGAGGGFGRGGGGGARPGGGGGGQR